MKSAILIPAAAVLVAAMPQDSILTGVVQSTPTFISGVVLSTTTPCTLAVCTNPVSEPTSLYTTTTPPCTLAICTNPVSEPTSLYTSTTTRCTLDVCTNPVSEPTSLYTTTPSVVPPPLIPTTVPTTITTNGQTITSSAVTTPTQFHGSAPALRDGGLVLGALMAGVAFFL